MITLGVCADEGTHAAVVKDGTLVSAVSGANDVVACVEEALAVASLEWGTVSRILATSSEAVSLLNGRGELVDRERAHAAQLRAISPSADIVVLVDDAANGRLSAMPIDSPADDNATRRPQTVLEAVSSVARALGTSTFRPIAALESIAMLATPAGARGVEADDLTLDETAIETMLVKAAARTPVGLDAANSPHVPTQQLRASIAASVLDSLARHVACVAERSGNGRADLLVGLGGSAFDSPAFTARVRQRCTAVVAPVPGSAGSALGAALLPHQDLQPLRHVALGRTFGDDEIKATLDNCRLEYIYEPQWPRLFARTSQLLATGAIVGWFQGRSDFGGQSLGSRSFLCDASSRYSRANVNVFLLNRSIDTPLQVSLAAPPTGDDTFRFSYADAAAVPGAQKLVSAIDRAGRVLCHVPDAGTAPELRGLLDAHAGRTGVIGLLNVPMTTGGRLTHTPREALRETFGSSADALVIGRFIVAKDYWLLRR